MTFEADTKEEIAGMNMKTEIEDRNLWYYVECRHCGTVFMVEESIDRAPPNLEPSQAESKPESFNVFCPRCNWQNKVETKQRIRLAFGGIAFKEEVDAQLTRVRQTK